MLHLPFSADTELPDLKLVLIIYKLIIYAFKATRSLKLITEPIQAIRGHAIRHSLFQFLSSSVFVFKVIHIHM